MSPRPTGVLRRTTEGRDLVLTRTFAAPIDDVWASITEPERTALWFADWWGEPGPGRQIHFRLTLEEGAPEAEMTIVACEAPRHLAVAAVDQYGSWNLEATLAERDGVTEMTFTHHLDDAAGVGELGPGWEFYLDALGAARDGRPKPDFDDYYPAQQAYYQALVPEA